MNVVNAGKETVFEAPPRRHAGGDAGAPSRLEEACGPEAALRRRADAPLGADDRPGALLNPLAAPGVQPNRLPPFAWPEKPGDRLGHYKILQQIGEGGCGVVYKAEQQAPVRRQVALKVIKPGMDTKQVVARFEAERQALALLDHHHIAQVLDAGVTETGRPYFVMELARGIRITDYCDLNNLATRERLGLFVQVCRAIHHAHQRGIIHRDIKPSNILITLQDGVPVPKVIDFGIAKATQGRLTDQTLFTAFDQFIGTPAYMSPEQAGIGTGLPGDVDARSDVYSLGVLLYELLTGTTPFDSTQLAQGGLDSLRRTLWEQEPVRPSTRLSTMLAANLTATARHRRTEPGKLTSIIRGDLDWIVMKCLEKDRRRRYETASDLAMDLERYLNQEAVVARPPRRFYRLGKLVGRNKLAFAATVAALGSLAFGFGLSARLMVAERTASRRAAAAEVEQARLRQQADASRMLAVAGLLYDRQQYAQAAQIITQQGLASSSALKNSSRVEAYMILAMAQYRLNKAAEANAALVAGLDLAQTIPCPDSASGRLPGYEWDLARALAAEARGLLQGASKTYPLTGTETLAKNEQHPRNQ